MVQKGKKKEEEESRGVNQRHIRQAPCFLIGIGRFLSRTTEYKENCETVSLTSCGT